MISIGEFLQGIISIIFVIITFLLGIKLIQRYKHYRYKESLYMGYVILGLGSLWVSDAYKIFVLLWVKSITPEIVIINFILTGLFIPFIILLWIYVVLLLTGNTEKYSKSFSVYGLIYVLLFETIYILTFLLEPDYSEFHYISLSNDILLFSSLIIAFVFELVFVRKSMRLKSPEIILRGRILLIAFILFTGGALLDALVRDVFIHIIGRSILVVSSILFYLGFILPERMKDRLIFKNKDPVGID